MKRRTISRHFRKHMDIYERQVFTGPPENTRDHVLAAAKALMVGDWRKCASLILDLELWALVPGDGAGEATKEMLRGKSKAEARRTYLFTYSAYYESLSLSQLCVMFELDANIVHGLVSKMMINHELHASWNQPTSTIVLHKVEPTHLQALALQYAEKTALLVESNERLLDACVGGYGYKDDWQRGNQDRRWGGQERWRKGGGGAGWKPNDPDRDRGDRGRGRGGRMGRGDGRGGRGYGDRGYGGYGGYHGGRGRGW